ncbi:unnamed protein product, partial [marine sediment metagenome]
PHDFSDMLEQLAPAIAHEASAANVVKQAISPTVVIGNPPYSKLSQNRNAWIDGLMERYKTTVKTQEVQRQALSNDYVKFFCASAHYLSRSAGYVFGMITDNSYLDGPLFRDMRADLLISYPCLRIIDLLGNARKRASTEGDENVFDIRQGVAIFLGSRSVSLAGTSALYASLTGSREHKGGWLLSNSSETTPFERSAPADPHYFLTPQPSEEPPEWQGGIALPDVFAGGTRAGRPLPFNGAALATRHDALAIAFTV